MISPEGLRRFVYDTILSNGRIPSAAAIGVHFGASEAEALGAIGGLKIGKTILRHPVTGEIWMAGPFASTPSGYTVMGSRASWQANCAWDMLGVAALVKEPVHIETWCTDCAEPMRIEVDPGRGPAGQGLVHFLVPARRWYDDIGFT